MRNSNVLALSTAFFVTSNILPNPALSWGWSDASEDTRNSAIFDAGLNAGDGTRNQIIELANKRVTAGHMRQLARGNKKVMAKAARQLTGYTTYFGKIAGTGVVKYGGIAFTAADGVASSFGHLSVGQYADAGTVFVTESAETVSAMGGAAAGGWSGAKIGTFIGGIPGGLVGGAIGAIGGAAIGGGGFTILAGEELGAMANYLLSSKDIDPQVKVKLARDAYFKKKQLERNKKNYETNMIRLSETQAQIQQEAEVAMTGIGWESSDEREAVIVKGSMSLPDDLLDDKPAEIPKLRADPNYRQKEVPGLRSSTSSLPTLPPKVVKTEPAVKEPEKKRTQSTPEKRRKLRKELMKKADRLTARGGGPLAEGYGATPVIPATGIIDMVSWNPESPEHKTHFTWYLNGGEGKSSFEQAYEKRVHPHNNSSGETIYYPWTVYYEATGALNGNVIQATGRGWASDGGYRYTIESSWEKRVGDGTETQYSFCDYRVAYDSTSQETIIFNLDGTFNTTVHYKQNSSYTVAGKNCNDKNWAENNSKASKSQGYEDKAVIAVGIWQLR